MPKLVKILVEQDACFLDGFLSFFGGSQLVLGERVESLPMVSDPSVKSVLVAGCLRVKHPSSIGILGLTRQGGDGRRRRLDSRRMGLLHVKTDAPIVRFVIGI